MRIKTIYKLSLLFFLLPFLVWGQNPFYINYDTNDGLPSSETYFAHEDANGLIWIATDRGVSAYDGYQFHTYTTTEGLSNNTLFRIFRDPKNRLWFTALDGSLSIFENGTFQALPIHKDSIYTRYPGFAQQLLFDDNQNILITKRSSNINRPVTLLSFAAGEFFISDQSISDFKDYVWKNEEKKQALMQIGDRHLFFNREFQISIDVVLIDSTSGVVNFDGGRSRYFTKDSLSSFQPFTEFNVHNFFLDPKHNLWLCTMDGLLLYENANLRLPPRHFFKGLEVTSILTDREGSYWMTSREQGVFWIPSFDFQSLLRPEQVLDARRVLSIGKLPNFLVFGTANDGVFAIDQEFNFSTKLKSWNQVKNTKQMYPLRNTIYTSSFHSIKEVVGELSVSEIGQRVHNGSFIKELKNGLFLYCNTTTGVGYSVYTKPQRDHLLFSTYNNAYKDANPFFKNKKDNPLFNLRINCVEELGDTLIMGGLDGIYRLNSGELLSNIPHKDTTSLLNIRVNDMICLDAQKLWIATIGNGLVFQNGQHYQQLSREDGMSSNFINSICLENDSTLWAGTNKGLNRVRFRYEEQGIRLQSISSFSVSDGLISNFINDVVIWKEHLWLATDEGINYFRPEEIRESIISPLIRIEEILVGDQAIEDRADIQLRYDENDLIFNFLGLSFKKSASNDFYRYQLQQDDVEADWYYTDNRSMRFLDLAPGNYRFKVAAQNKNGHWSEETASVLFTIHPHFSDQLWFRVLALLFLIFLIGAGVFFRIRTIQSQEDQKRKLQGAELNALRNQMNPHFIFNSLNSIQSFIFHQDVKKANQYLSKFSKLMRNSLEYSKLEYISIAEEIRFIRAYLDLELLRFDDRFKVQIEIAPEIPVHHYFIPPLLLQPILENSIKHAFKKIAYQGQIDIQILATEQEQTIEVMIQDNGIGIKAKDSKSSKAKHQSRGLSIIENRIKLLNQNNNNHQATFNFSNRYNAKQQVIGTQAHFVIPIQFKKND